MKEMPVELCIDLRISRQRRFVNWHRRMPAAGLLGLVKDTFIGITLGEKCKPELIFPFHMRHGLLVPTNDYRGVNYTDVVSGGLGFNQGLRFEVEGVTLDQDYWTPIPSVTQGLRYTHLPTEALKELVNCFVPEDDGELTHKLAVGRIDQAVGVKEETRNRVKHLWEMKRNSKGGFNFIHKECGLRTFVDFLIYITVNSREYGKTENVND